VRDNQPEVYPAGQVTAPAGSSMVNGEIVDGEPAGHGRM
jgi:hypothetical protein